MGLRTLIVTYNNSGRLNEAIHHIETCPSLLRVSDLNDALEWAGKNPKDYKGKDSKIEALLHYLRCEYMKDEKSS